MLPDLAEQNEHQRARLTITEPKAEALDRIATAEGRLCITDAAKTLRMKPKALFSFLRQHGWLYRRPGSKTDRAKQARLDDRTLESKLVTYDGEDGAVHQRQQVRVTPKGLTRLSQMLTAADPLRLL